MPPAGPGAIVRLLARACCLLLGLAVDAGARAEQQPVDQATAEWTILVYMAADNDLERFAISDLNELEAGLPETGVEVIVLVDRARDFSDADGDWTGTRLYRIRPDQDPDRIVSEVLADQGEMNLGDGAALSRFIADGAAAAPARRYALVMWDHGGGWSNMAQDLDVPGSPDAIDELTLPELSDAIRRGLAAAGLQMLDIVGFDMCLMAQIETLAELQGLTRVVVASEAVEPGDGWPYDRLLPSFADGALGPGEQAAQIVRHYSDFYGERDEPVATLAAFDMARVGELIGAFDATLAAIEPALADHWTGISRAQFWSDGFATHGKLADIRQDEKALMSVDLLDMMERIRANSGGRISAEALAGLASAIERATIAARLHHRHRRSHGLAIYAPVRRDNLDESYRATRFASDSDWLAFLAALHGRQVDAAAPPQIVSMRPVQAESGAPAETVSFLSGALMELEIAGDNVLFVSGLDGELKGRELWVDEIGFLFDTADAARRIAEAGEFAELLAPSYAGKGASIRMSMLPTNSLLVSEGVAAHPTFDWSGTDSRGIPVQTVRAIYDQEGIGPRPAVVMIDVLRGVAAQVLLITEVGNGRQVPRMIEPLPDDRVTFMREVVDLDSGKSRLEPGGPAMRWGRGPQRVPDLTPPGERLVLASVETIAGASAVSSAPYRVTLPGPEIMDSIAAARALPGDIFLGEWRTQTGEPFARFRPAGDGLMEVDLLLPGMAQAGTGGRVLAEFDQRGLPTLLLYTLDADGRLVGNEELEVLHGAQPDTLVLYSFLATGNDPRGALVPITRQTPFPAHGATQQESQAGAQPGTAAPAAAAAGQPTGGAATAALAPFGPAQLAGAWEGQVAGGSWLMLALDADGTYFSEEAAESGDFYYVEGRWWMEGTQLVLDPEAWDAPEVCDAQGCRPPAPPQTVRLPVSLNATGALVTGFGALQPAAR